MDFMKLLKSFEELLYEVLSWFVFYPMTLWRAVRHPQQSVRRATAIAADDEAAEDDGMSPPLFLLITLLIAHGIEIAIRHGAAPDRLPPLLQKDSNLLLTRAILFCIFPLVMAVLSLRGRGAALNRTTLRAPFFGQCCLVAPTALAVSAGAILLHLDAPAAVLAAAAIVGAATVWYLAVEVRWFAHTLGCRRGRAARLAVGGYLLSVAIFFAANLLIALATPGAG